MLKKNKTDANHDKQLLLDAMQKIIAGDHSPIDNSNFEDPTLVDTLNNVILALKKINNPSLMKLNQGMEHIGDNSCVKKMLEQVTAQSEAIQNMSASSKELETSIGNISTEVEYIKDDAQSAISVSQTGVEHMTQTIDAVTSSTNEIRGINDKVQDFHEKIEQITQIIDMVKKIASQSGLLALNASIEAARAGEAGKGFNVVATQMRELSGNTTRSADTVVQYVTELRASIDELMTLVDSTTKHLEEGNTLVQQSVEDINSMSEHMVQINERITHIYDAVNIQTDVTNNFVQSIDSIAESYDILTQDCITTGNHLYRIGRYIDTTRNDIAKGFSALTVQDSLHVFQIDHFVLTWRIYNHLAGFEQLKLEQLNNPTGCKFGKWAKSQTDTRYINSSEFKDLIKKHEDIHTNACNSWYAVQDGDKAAALRHFDLTLDSFYRFQESMDRFRKYMRGLGFTEETDFQRF